MRQVDLAQAVGVSEAAVQKWESGENEPRTRNLVRIAEVLGRSVAWLRTGQDEEALTAVVRGVAVTGPPEKVLALLDKLPDNAPPAAAGDPEPGVVALLADEQLCRALSLTDEQRDTLLQARSGALSTKHAAINFLLAVIRGE